MTKNALTLRAYWSTREKDVVYCWPSDPSDAHLLHTYFFPEMSAEDLVKALELHGCDITTLRFSIKISVPDET